MSTLAHSASDLSPDEVVPQGLSETDLLANTDRERNSKLFGGIRGDFDLWSTQDDGQDPHLHEQLASLSLLSIPDFPFTCVADLVYAPFDLLDDQHYQSQHARWLESLKKLDKNFVVPSDRVAPATLPTRLSY